MRRRPPKLGERRRGRISHHPCLNPAPGKVIRIPRSPRRLHLAAPLLLAIRAAAGVLPPSHSVVRKKPKMTDAARTLPARWHDDPSSRRPAAPLRAYLDYMRGGLVLLSRHGSVLESAEDASSGRRNLDSHGLSEASFTGPGYSPTSDMREPVPFSRRFGRKTRPKQQTELNLPVAHYRA